MPKYTLFFVPHFSERKKISPLRSLICKRAYSTQALQYPVHMSLISGGFFTKHFKAFEKDLKTLCSEQKPFTMTASATTSVLPERFWTGIHLKRTKEIKDFQTQLQALRNKYAEKKQEHHFAPLHITLAFPAEVDHLTEIKSPVNTLVFDRVTIVQKEKEGAPYRILKHIPLG